MCRSRDSNPRSYPVLLARCAIYGSFCGCACLSRRPFLHPKHWFEVTGVGIEPTLRPNLTYLLLLCVVVVKNGNRIEVPHTYRLFQSFFEKWPFLTDRPRQ